ncbi:MAG TPA: ATP-binding protein [bacterium]|nr:ATP-binding protein [bacterium]
MSIDDTSRLFAGVGGADGAWAELMRSLAVLPMRVDRDRGGVLVLGSRETWHFGPETMGCLEEAAAVIGAALAHREARRDLRERVKEMTCLYGMAQVAANPQVSSEEFLEKCIELLPAAFRHPLAARARITFDGRTAGAAGFPERGARLAAPIRFGGRQRGLVEVAYAEDLPPRDLGPFLREEETLLQTVAENVAVILEQRQASAEVHGLLDQLRHADRLATIGQVTAGVVHELNEPLGGILGFAQLAKKAPGLTGQTRQDIDKIIAAALHAREVVRRLMLFARRLPPRKNRVNLNDVITEGLYFLESRCERLGIALERELQPDLPELAGDASQLYQVLVNLVVNAIQAMPEGGFITIRTEATAAAVILSVADTGVGMSEGVRAKALQPFFTTKSVTEGTGLGLAVVNGIVAAHGGTIEIESEEGKGSRFTVRLPRRTGEDELGEGR